MALRRFWHPPATPPNTPDAPQFKHCLRRAKNVVVTFNYIHIFCLPNVPRNPTSYKADGSTWLCLSRSLSLPFSVLHTFLSFCLVGVAHKLSFRFLANCAKCTKMLNTCQLPSSKSVEVPKWGLCYTRKGARWRRLPRLLRTHLPPPLITWMPARLPGTSLKCANAKRHLHLHTKCKRNSTRALTTECEGRSRGSRGRNWGQALCQLVGVELCVWGRGVVGFMVFIFGCAHVSNTDSDSDPALPAPPPLAAPAWVLPPLIVVVVVRSHILLFFMTFDKGAKKHVWQAANPMYTL